MPSIIQMLLPALVGVSILPNLLLAQQDNGPCVKACPAKSSACDGDETGSALDQCTCASFSLNNDPLVTCVQQCPESEQIIFANNLPALCNSLLFPDLDLGDSSSASGATLENTASSASGPQETASSTSATTTSSGTTTASAGSAAASASNTGNAAAVLLPAAAAGYLVYVAGMAAAWL